MSRQKKSDQCAVDFNKTFFFQDFGLWHCLQALLLDYWKLVNSGSRAMKTLNGSQWRSLDIILKTKFTIQMDSMFFYGEGMFMVFLHLFLTQYPATTSYLLTGLHYNRPDEFKLQSYI